MFGNNITSRNNSAAIETAISLAKPRGWNAVRLWCIRKLGGVDRAATQSFAREFLMPNGKACVTVTEDGVTVFNKTIEISGEMLTGVAVAPWARATVLAGLRFAVRI